MILFYKVTYHRLDTDESFVFGYYHLKDARSKFDDLLKRAYDNDVPCEKFVLRLGEVRVESNGVYSDKLVEIQ